MRIAQFIETLSAGGAEVLAVDIANTLAARGHESWLFVLRGDGPLRDRVSDQVHLEILDRDEAQGSILRRVGLFKAVYKQFAGLVRAHGIEVVQTHLPRANFLGLFLGRAGDVRVYPTIHNTQEFNYGRKSAWYMDFVRRRAYRQMLVWCFGMIAVSDKVRAAMISNLGLGSCRLAERIVVARNGVAIPETTSRDERKQVRDRYGVRDDELLLVAVGRLSFQKNMNSLVQALAELARLRDNWRCVIAGRGEDEEILRSSIADCGLEQKIHLAGHVADVSELLAAGDIFCMPSRFEGLPLVLLEALAAGLPVCAYRIPGVAEVVEEGREGLLAVPEDHEDLARALLALVEAPERRRAMSRAAKALAVKEFNFESTVDRLLEIYDGQR